VNRLSRLILDGGLDPGDMARLIPEGTELRVEVESVQ
jgi:hypothetical protein